MWLLIAFISIPLIEIALFIQIGGAIGLLPTLAVVVVTAIVGTYLVRQQGSMALSQLRNRLQSFGDPTEQLAHGAMILFSGAMLLTPGFFTDACGFALLIPRVREAVISSMKTRINVQTFSSTPRYDSDEVIVTDYEDVTAETSSPKQPSGWTKN